MSKPKGLPTNKEEMEMLVLSRKRDERIMIGENIVITVVEIRDGKVRLGIDAPKDVTVHREEVYRSMAAEHKKDAIS